MAVDGNSIINAACTSAIVLGAFGVAAPDSFARLYGLPTDDTTVALGRVISSRNAALGVLGISASRQSTRRGYLVAMAVMNALDAALALRSDGVAGSSRLRIAATSAGFAFASIAAIRLDSKNG